MSWTAGTPQGRDNGGIPANVFSMNLADRIKLSKGVRKLPVAYTMSGACCLSLSSVMVGGGVRQLPSHDQRLQYGTCSSVRKGVQDCANRQWRSAGLSAKWRSPSCKSPRLSRLICTMHPISSHRHRTQGLKGIGIRIRC